MTDSEEEIFVRKKAKSKKVFQDSESEDGEDGGSFVQNDVLGGDNENGEEKENVTAQRNKKSHRIRQGLLDSDDSDAGDQLQVESLETSRKSGLLENEPQEERPLKPGKKYRKHKQHKEDFEEETAKKAVGKSRRRKEKERRIESLKELKKEKKPKAEVYILAENLRCFLHQVKFIAAFGCRASVLRHSWCLRSCCRCGTQVEIGFLGVCCVHKRF